MRFIGNKESITHLIREVLEKRNLTGHNLILFDAFCGTGSVSDSLKDSFRIVANDILSWCVVYTEGRICASQCNYEKLGLDPFCYLNESKEIKEGFFYENYSPGGSNRMYFTSENAGRIDYFREQIEEWKREGVILEVEYSHLIASLIESVSDVANTAGVYGAFLKDWDPRALKKIKFSRVDSKQTKHNKPLFLNNKLEHIISEVECDVLYLDPPYTQNQYGTQYHLFETLVLNDCPEISPITGSRKTAPMRSDWSKNYKAHILFDMVLAKTKAKYIVLSYNSDGFMSKDFIEASLKRYGKPETYVCNKISYKKYRNFKTKSRHKHFEYLYFIEKKTSHEICYESPLNYIGSKSKIIKDIKGNLPSNINVFIDAFGGGFNVGVNANADHLVYNDNNFFVRQIVESFRRYDTYNYLLYLKKMINKFKLEKSNNESYVKARDYYNSLPLEKRDPRLLYAIILYGYQQQIRFNGDHKFNNPVGMRWFNNKVLEKMISFSRAIKERSIAFKSCDFTELKEDVADTSFVYMDPPYRLTTGSYNDGKRGFGGWTVDSENALFEFADSLNAQGKRFMISYVLEHNGKTNNQFEQWIKENGYRLINIGSVPGRKRAEVLVVNYG